MVKAYLEARKMMVSATAEPFLRKFCSDSRRVVTVSRTGLRVEWSYLEFIQLDQLEETPPGRLAQSPEPGCLPD